MDLPEIDPVELKRRLDLDEPLALLDVREPFERDHCAIAAPAGTPDLHVPLRRVPDRFDEIRALAASSGGPLVVYCHHGVRSEMAARWLAAQGVEGATNLAGGIDAWSLRADPGTPRYR